MDHGSVTIDMHGRQDPYRYAPQWHRFTQYSRLGVGVKVRYRNNVDGESEYLLELALKSREVEQTNGLIEVDGQVDVGFLVIRSLSNTSEDPGISAAVGSDDAKDERTILRQDLISGRDALKAQEAGHLRLASSDRAQSLAG